MMITAKIAPDLDGHDARRDARIDASAEVGLRELGNAGVDAQLINISSLGFMAKTDAEIAPGSRVWLTLPGISRANALVVWAKAGKLGGEFAAPIDPLKVLQAIGNRSNTGRG
ncbi:MAG: hypothetical protein JWN69_858 [Alphaproteobacteria bacterium]|nr:hypothetical protein [Alphaproteobacteria bacterium]